MGQARLREALNAGGPGTQKEKGPPVADGVLTVTPDTPEALEWKSRRSAIDSAGTSSSYLEDEEGTSAKLFQQEATLLPNSALAKSCNDLKQSPSQMGCMASSPGR